MKQKMDLVGSVSVELSMRMFMNAKDVDIK